MVTSELRVICCCFSLANAAFYNKGESGLGKSTLINSLFLTDLYSSSYPGPSSRIKKTVKVSISDKTNITTKISLLRNAFQQNHYTSRIIALFFKNLHTDWSKHLPMILLWEKHHIKSCFWCK